MKLFLCVFTSGFEVLLDDTARVFFTREEAQSYVSLQDDSSYWDIVSVECPRVGAAAPEASIPQSDRGVAERVSAFFSKADSSSCFVVVPEFCDCCYPKKPGCMNEDLV